MAHIDEICTRCMCEIGEGEEVFGISDLVYCSGLCCRMSGDVMGAVEVEDDDEG
jgi:hypothetical protein